jgi:hypothetical protein
MVFEIQSDLSSAIACIENAHVLSEKVAQVVVND